MESYALNELDIKIKNLFPEGGKFFIEAGFNDGITQSNTYLLEKEYEWKGLLVEPNIKICEKCKINRPNSIVENYALVSSNFDGDFISGDFDHDSGHSLMSSVFHETSSDLPIHINERSHRESVYNIISVPTITLDKLIRKHQIEKIDFVSLDVEGYEIEVLNGIDFSYIRPIYFLLETSNDETMQERVRGYMKNKNYKFIQPLSGNDDLFLDNLAQLNNQ